MRNRLHGRSEVLGRQVCLQYDDRLRRLLQRYRLRDREPADVRKWRKRVRRLRYRSGQPVHRGARVRMLDERKSRVRARAALHEPRLHLRWDDLRERLLQELDDVHHATGLAFMRRRRRFVRDLRQSVR